MLTGGSAHTLGCTRIAGRPRRDHIGVVVSDIAKSKAFYTQAFWHTGHLDVVELQWTAGADRPLVLTSDGKLPYNRHFRLQFKTCPEFSIPSSSKAVAKGAGLHPSISYGIVGYHRGILAAANMPDGS